MANRELYKNPDPRCTSPFDPSFVGYCWSYVNHADGDLNSEQLLKKCEVCELWKPTPEKGLSDGK